MAIDKSAPAEAWDALGLELIAFPVDPDSSVEQNWFAELTGEQPESLRRRHERIDSGEHHGALNRLILDLTRIRWGIGPIITVDTADGIAEPPHLGPYSEAVEWFVPLMEKWLREHSPPIKRLAFVGQLLKPSANKDESYKELGRLLPRVDVDPSASEFQYKINRPRPSSSLADAEFNRLCTWGAVRMEIGMKAIAGGASRTIKKEFFGSMLHMDISTPQDRDDPLPHEQLAEIWAELVGFANTIAAKGDSR